MKKLSFFLMAMLVSLTSFAAALGEGYSKVTDITTLSAGDKVVLYSDDAELGITGWDGNKTATAAAEGWVEYVVEAAEGGVLLKDGEKYVNLTAKNSFHYTATGGVCKVTADGILYITLSGSDYLLYENANNGSPVYRMYVDKTGNAQYKPFYVYEVVAAEEGGEGEGEVATVPTNAELWEAFKPYYNTYYGLARDLSHPVTNVSTFANAKMQEIMTDAASEYKWLGDYILGVAAGQGVNLPTDMAAVNEGAWRWAVHAFFNAAAGQHGAAGTDFTEAGKPENWGPYYLAAKNGTTPEPEPTTETVYFINTKKWAAVTAHAWGAKLPDTAWPGLATVKEADQIAGYDVYSFTTNVGDYANVIFNNKGGGSQTPDLVWTAGKYYVMEMGWLTKEEAETKLAAPLPETWNIVGDAGLMGKGWDLNAAENAMTKQADGTYLLEKKDITLTAGSYEYKAAKDHGWDVSVPSGQTNQKLTISKSGIYDVTFVLDVTAKKLTATATLKKEAVVIPTVVIAGDMNGWNQTKDKFTMAADSLTATFKATLTAKSYGFKMIVGGAWLSDGKTVTRAASTYKFTGANGGDSKLTADIAGEYLFTWEYATKTLTVTYPALPVKYNVTVTAENGTVTGAGTYEEGKTATLTATAAEGYEFVNWTVGDSIVSTDNPYSFVVTADVALVANFKAVEPEVEKPEPTYTENKLNPYAFGLESKLSDDGTTLVVTYRLNNSNATSVDVVIYNGEDVVATIPGTTTIGKNTVEVATKGLPGGVELTWGVVVKGTSVEAPTQETKMYNMYCPHGLAIDKDPESEYFGRILVADAMDVVKDKTGYLGSGIGAGLHAFNPSFTTDSIVYKGGNDFTRILASNGYQPWRVKISEDGRIFVSSLDLNGVVVWEVSKDLQTWTPVIAGTNDATDHNIYDADGNFVAGINCSMDVTGKGEDLKLLLYSTNNKGIAFNQSGYRLDEYALGTATTWTGTPKNILEGGKLGVVHTNVEFIYDGEGGYWFGGSRAGNAGQPNLVHINAAGEQDYYTEDASLYGGDGVLVHNGMLFKGKARTSGTVGNFGVWTIGKDADGKVTLTEKWSVVADGIGRNLNEFAVDYAENLYAVGNSGEKIIAYALPYSGEVTTPAAAKYAFQLPEAEVVKVVGTVKRAVQLDKAAIVLTHEADGTAHIYKVVDGVVKSELSQEGVVPVDPENKGSYLAISDIAVTEDGKLVANNYVRNQFAGTTPESGYKLGTSYYYIWNDLAGAPAVWFTSQTTARSSHGDVGVTFALKGTSTNAELLVTAVHNNNRAVRLAKYNIIDGQYVEPNISGGQQSSEYYEYFGTHTKEAYYQEAVQGKQFQLSASPLGEGRWIMDGELVNPSEFVLPAVGENYAASDTLTEDLGKKYNGASYVTVGEQVLMVAPYATPEGKLTGVMILDVTAGLDSAQYVDQLFIDEAVEATAAATAVEVVEGDDVTSLLITLVADATIYSLEAELSNGADYQIYEDEITNMAFDLDNLIITGGPSTAFQVEVVLALGDSNPLTGEWQVKSESSVSIMGTEATFVEGTVFEVDAFAPSAKAIVRCEWNGQNIELHLTMSAAPMEATKVVVEDAVVEVEKFIIFGDTYDYSLKMTGVWHNEEDGLDYPVLVEVPVYYPEATEPSETMSTVTVGDMDDEDGEDGPWLGFGEGTLTVTTVDGVVTATGIVQNPMAGVAIDITISGKLAGEDPGTALENATVVVKAVKLIKNGQLIINKGDVEYNAQGAIVK